MGDPLRLVRWVRRKLVWASLCVSVAGCSSSEPLLEEAQVCDGMWLQVEIPLHRREASVPLLLARMREVRVPLPEGLSVHLQEVQEQAIRVHPTSEKALKDIQQVHVFQQEEERLRVVLAQLFAFCTQEPACHNDPSLQHMQQAYQATEAELLRARERYNRSVLVYNTKLFALAKQFRHKIFGLSLQPRVYLEAVEGVPFASQGILFPVSSS